MSVDAPATGGWLPRVPLTHLKSIMVISQNHNLLRKGSRICFGRQAGRLAK